MVEGPGWDIAPSIGDKEEQDAGLEKQRGERPGLARPLQPLLQTPSHTEPQIQLCLHNHMDTCSPQSTATHTWPFWRQAWLQ